MKKWYEVQAKAEDKTQAEVSIFDEIGMWGIGADQFIRDVKALGGVKDILLMINSPGGSVFEGYTIYNYLKGHPAEINVRVMGVAASIASVIAMAGDLVEMPENSMLMIHNPTGGCMGQASDMRSVADALDKIKLGILSSYVKKSGNSEADLAKMMDDETWITAKEAVKMGLADVVSDEVQMAASLDPDKFKAFKNVPESIIAGFKNAGKPKEQEEKKMKITVDLLKAEHPEIVAALQDEVKVDLDAIRAEGAENERNRIQDVRAQSIPGHEKLIETLAFDGKTTGAEAAIQIVQAEKNVRKLNLENQVADGKDVRVPDQSADTDLDPDDSNLPLEDRCNAEWKKDKALRAEFGNDFDSYLAYMDAKESGATT